MRVVVYPGTIIVPPAVIERDPIVFTTDRTDHMPKWKPCHGCGGTGGAMRSVDWAVSPQWISCIFCYGGGGSFSG